MTTRRWIVALGATAVISSFSSILALRILSEEAEDVGGLRATLQSAVLDEQREYVVHLPEGYGTDPTARYPVLYVLDGVAQSGHTAASASLLARIGIGPALIVVGVPSVDGETRNRDYTPPDMRLDTDTQDSPMGAADHFLSFLQSELIKRVEQDYRTTRPRMLAGWSRGGLFVVYSEIVAPSLFQARFAHSPALWRESDLVVTRVEKLLDEGPPPEGFLYLSVGEHENEKMRAAFKHMVAVLERRAPATLRWRADVTIGGVHETNPRLATPIGLCAMFSEGTSRACARTGFKEPSQ
jgi:hypothetical protein